jgi:Tfp pilus assembly protein PilF
MFRNARLSHSVLILLSLAAGLAGCRQPEVGYQKTWSERWTEQLSSWKTPEWEKQQRPKPEVPGPKPDEKMTAAVMLEHEGKIDRAIAVYEEIVRKDSHRADVHHRLAQLYDINGEPDKALKHYQAALKRNPKDSDLLCDLGYHYYLIAQPAQAEKVLRQAIAQQPTLARAHNNLGLVLAQSGRHDEALTAFKSAGSDLATAHVNLAYALMWDEHWADAARQIDLALAADPSSKLAQKAQASMNKVATAVHRGQQAGAKSLPRNLAGANASSMAQWGSPPATKLPAVAYSAEPVAQRAQFATQAATDESYRVATGRASSATNAVASAASQSPAVPAATRRPVKAPIETVSRPAEVVTKQPSTESQAMPSEPPHTTAKVVASGAVQSRRVSAAKRPAAKPPGEQVSSTTQLVIRLPNSPRHDQPAVQPCNTTACLQSVVQQVESAVVFRTVTETAPPNKPLAATE